MPGQVVAVVSVLVSVQVSVSAVFEHNINIDLVVGAAGSRAAVYRDNIVRLERKRAHRIVVIGRAHRSRQTPVKTTGAARRLGRIP